MRELLSCCANFSALPLDDGALQPQVEVILIVSEPTYSLDPAGGQVKSREVSQLRFTTSAKQVLKLAEALTQFSAEAEKLFEGYVQSKPTT